MTLLNFAILESLHLLSLIHKRVYHHVGLPHPRRDLRGLSVRAGDEFRAWNGCPQPMGQYEDRVYFNCGSKSVYMYIHLTQHT